MSVGFRLVATPLGEWLAAQTDDGLSFLSLNGKQALAQLQEYAEDVLGEELVEGTLPEVTQALGSYAAGELREFTLSLDLRGTDFQLAVWAGLCRIPFGETRTYAELAEDIGRAGACRAVGLANGRNPVPVVVPCHRVVAKDGLGGFTGGLEHKVTLLDHERAHAKRGQNVFDFP